MVRVSLWVPCWTNLRLIKVILVASTLTYLSSPEVASSKSSLLVSSDPLLVRITSSGIRAWFLIQVLSYPIIFLCNLSRFVFCPCSVICFLVCVLLRSCLCLCFVLVLVLVTFLFLVLFLVSFRLCVKKKICLSFVSSKKIVVEFKKKRRKTKVGVWSLNTKLRHLDVFFWKENRGSNPLF